MLYNEPSGHVWVDSARTQNQTKKCILLTGFLINWFFCHLQIYKSKQIVCSPFMESQWLTWHSFINSKEPQEFYISGRQKQLFRAIWPYDFVSLYAFPYWKQPSEFVILPHKAHMHVVRLCACVGCVCVAFFGRTVGVAIDSVGSTSLKCLFLS